MDNLGPAAHIEFNTKRRTGTMPMSRIQTDTTNWDGRWLCRNVEGCCDSPQSPTRFAIAYVTSPFLVKQSGEGSRKREGRTEKFPALESIQSSLDHSICCTRIVQECTIHSSGTNRDSLQVNSICVAIRSQTRCRCIRDQRTVQCKVEKQAK